MDLIHALLAGLTCQMIIYPTVVMLSPLRGGPMSSLSMQASAVHWTHTLPTRTPEPSGRETRGDLKTVKQ